MIDLMEYADKALVVGFVVILQMVKYLLEKVKGITLKKETWLMISLGSGVALAVIALGIDNFESFNVFNFIKMSFIYGASCTMAYKLGKTTIAKLTEFLSDEEDEKPVE